MSWVPFTPAFTTLSEVVSHLNITGPDDNGNCTIFGLTISESCLQSQIDHANKYIFSLVPSLSGPGCLDPREPAAELAATDLACIDILVAASGGIMLGATDYKLGDLFVTKGTIEKFALQEAVQSYQTSFNHNIVNLSTVAAGAKATLGFRVPGRGPYFFQ